MKTVRSHVLIEFDKEDRKAIEGIASTFSTQTDRWFGINRVFFRGDFVDSGWEFVDVEHPQMSKSKLLGDIRATRAAIKSLDERLAGLAERVKEAS